MPVCLCAGFVTRPQFLFTFVAFVLTVHGILISPANADFPSTSKAVPVRVIHDKDAFRLERGGSPYVVKGVGGSGSMKLLASLGGNSVRTWGVDHLQEVLDDAQANGLTVAVGIWLGHERHGFDYSNAEQVAKQAEEVRQAVLKYRDHPAVLLWGLGNEMEGYGAGDNAAVWLAVNHLAQMVKTLDPNHPTMTVVAEIGGDRVKNIHRLCPSIDLVGINSYGGAATLPERYRKAGGTKPYLVTEFGPPGSWETSKNNFGTPLELTSTQKAECYRASYTSNVQENASQCLGSYAFLWGHKQEATPTWFGMLLPNGSRVASADVMSELWTGKPPADRCPEVIRFKLEGSDIGKPGEERKLTLEARDPEGEPLKVHWRLDAEAAVFSTGGDAEVGGNTVNEAIVSSSETGATIRLPKEGGVYRVYIVVEDGHGGAATANLPFKVDAPEVIRPAPVAKLPLVLDPEESSKPAPYIPAGWMGNTKSLKINPSFDQSPHAGKTCMRVEYQAPDQWAGVVWQSPPGDWGDAPGGWNLAGAKRLTFWARGAHGGEKVSFELGLIGASKKYSDSGSAKLADVILTPEWKQYTIPLAGKDLSRIKSGFVFVLSGQGKPVTFDLDDIEYVSTSE